MKRSPIAIICTSLLIIAATTVYLTSNGTKVEAATLTRAEVDRQIAEILAQFGLIESMADDMHVCAINDEHFDTLEGGCMDLMTELVWGTANLGVGGNWTFGSAEQFVEDSTEGGFTDWRLPTRDELETLVDSNWQAHFAEGFHGLRYWSSTGGARSAGGLTSRPERLAAAG